MGAAVRGGWRDDQMAALANGIDMLKVKVTAFAGSVYLGGLCDVLVFDLGGS